MNTTVPADPRLRKRVIAAVALTRRSEASVNRAEAALKRLEARRLLSKLRWIELSIPGATVIVAGIGFLGSFVASYVKGWSDIELVRQKYNSDLVLKAVTAVLTETEKTPLDGSQ